MRASQMTDFVTSHEYSKVINSVNTLARWAGLAHGLAGSLPRSRSDVAKCSLGVASRKVLLGDVKVYFVLNFCKKVTFA